MFHEFVIYGVGIEASDNEVTGVLKNQTSDVLSARRILKYPDRSTTTLVRVRVKTRECQHQYLRYGCVMNGIFHRTEHSKSRPLLRRCYQCQAISTHIAQTCQNQVKCMKCAGPHSCELCEETIVMCANCEGNHASSSISCPHWIRQTQLRREYRASHVPESDVNRLVHEMKAEMTSQFKALTDRIKSLKDDVIEMKCTIASHLRFPCSENKPQDMTWDEYDRNASHPLSPDELSDIDCSLLHPPTEPKPTNDQQTVSPESPRECEPLSTQLHSSPATQTNDYCVNSDVNNKSVNTNHEKQKPTVLEKCDTTVNAQSITDKPYPEQEKGFISPSDPAYRDYHDRISKWTREEVEQFRNYFNPFKGEVLFRYCSGSIGSKIINVISPDRSVNNIKPCAAPMSRVKNLTTATIRCCPFHHLASEIKDTVDRDDLVNSLCRWRTKDVSAYCKGWQSTYHKAMQKRCGRR